MRRFWQQFPPQIGYIVGNEAAERYSYYGMRSILVIFMTKNLLMKEASAVSAYHYFAAACYLLPLLGAFLSDRFLGKYRTIMWLSLVYCAGHAVLALNESEVGMYWGLGLIALGAGGIKPCASAHVGDQFKATEKEKLEKVFGLFYWMINFGSFFATLITPWTFAKYGPQVAFGIPGVLMFVATIVFWMGRKKYVHVPPTGANPHSFLRVIWSGLTGNGASFWDKAKANHGAEVIEGVRAVFGVMVLFIWISVFWSLYDQGGSTWVLQAQKMNLNFLGIEWNEAQVQALNPILILLMVPLFSGWIYPTLEKWGVRVTPVRKMAWGMFIAALGFATVAVVQMAIDRGQAVSIGWQFIPYVVTAASEMLVSITGLEFAYTQAPRAMKSTVMSFFLLTVFVGNMFTAWISKIDLYPTASTGYFWFFTGLMAATAVVFLFFAKRYKMQNFMESGLAAGPSSH